MSQAVNSKTATDFSLGANSLAASPSYPGLPNPAIGIYRGSDSGRARQVFSSTGELGSVFTAVCNRMVGGHGHELMLAVGIIEIVAGLGVAFKPKIFAYVVLAWLLLIVINLLMIPGYFDVALRDFGLSLGALALARLSQEFDK